MAREQETDGRPGAIQRLICAIKGHDWKESPEEGGIGIKCSRCGYPTMDNPVLDSMDVESLGPNTVTIDYDAYPNVTIDYDGETYDVVETDDGLELEVVTD